MTIAVFLSCSAGVSPMFLSEMELLGEGLAQDGFDVLYGGVNTGCMGALARGVLRSRGKLIGVLSQQEIALGMVQQGLSEQHVAATLSERKGLMIAMADAYVVCPGGLGTLDEALEVMTLKSLGSLQKPIYFYNFLGVWSGFLESLTLLVESRLIRQPLSELAVVLDNHTELRENLKHAF
jgi:uncharacterized protein (TIGR00730 family)